VAHTCMHAASTISSDPCTPESRRPRAPPAQPPSCLLTARRLRLPKPHRLPRARDRVSTFEIGKRASVFKLVNPNFGERGGVTSHPYAGMISPNQDHLTLEMSTSRTTHVERERERDTHMQNNIKPKPKQLKLSKTAPSTWS
jgi:hypothetical protein